MTPYARSQAALQARALAGSMREDVRDELDDTTMEVPVGAWRKVAELLDVLAEAVEDGDGEGA